MTMPSATEPDWTRETFRFLQWTPWRRLMRAIRAHQHWKTRGAWARPLRACATVRIHFWNIICSSDIPPQAKIGGGFCLPHPNGIVIHPDATIGVNCMFFQQVTIGVGGQKPGVPTIGGHVDIGAGAKILGGVVIGDHARIGANAVVLCDVPENATAVGMPARIILPSPAPRPDAPPDTAQNMNPEKFFRDARAVSSDAALTCKASRAAGADSPVSVR